MTDNENTQKLLNGRKSTYGNTTTNAQRVAKMWNGYLGTDIITPADMMMMMALYKAYRFKVTPDYSDNINDVLGYAQIVKDIQQELGGLIDAETVKEYLAKKNPVQEQTQQDTMRPPTEEDYVQIYGTVEERERVVALARELQDAEDMAELAESRRPVRLPNGLPDQTDGKLMDQWSRNRCGYIKGREAGFCMLHHGHDHDCDIHG